MVQDLIWFAFLGIIFNCMELNTQNCVPSGVLHRCVQLGVILRKPDWLWVLEKMNLGNALISDREI
jgi:hypothetical protein